MQALYAFSGSFIIVEGNSYSIEKLTENEFIFQEVSPSKPDNELIRYHYVSTPESSGNYFYRQFIKPFIRITAKGDTAYAFNEYIYPKFKYESNGYSVELDHFDDVYETSYNYIEKNFVYPPQKKSNFAVSFSVNKSGELKNVAIKESSDSSYNEALLRAVYKTERHWLPAVYANKKVETIFNYVFKYDNSEDANVDFDMEVYLNKKSRANHFFEKKEYVKAIKLYTECILMQDEDIEPLFKRAESYFALKINKNACLDWSYLAKKGQKKAEKLFMDNCMK
ncbi:TonB-like protein [Arcicella aurantiaca]|uniref:TonB-like protein n=1 Tax=Arcicella aurantiaca TaxID=591202 RepID=A0A316ESY2_9BACT|nr:TonB C-terminal domain-containing protein [Arcicella aurantiaca]PWK26270.1 TonB-like protein [Arcicella aurantiaca]